LRNEPIVDDAWRYVELDRQDPRSYEWWTTFCRETGSRDWNDVRTWLRDEYDADVLSTPSGFTIGFLHAEDAALFRLTWL